MEKKNLETFRVVSMKVEMLKLIPLNSNAYKFPELGTRQYGTRQYCHNNTARDNTAATM